jgi:hypothetical protein
MTNPKPTIEEQIEALAWLRKGWNGDNSERAINAFNILDDGDVFADLDEERNDREARPVISTQSAMDGKIYRSDGSVLPVPGGTEDDKIGLPALKPGEEIRPAFSDTHPRAARELGDVIGGDGE